MKKLILIAAMLLACGCGSTPKITMKNCEKMSNGFYQCDPVPENNRNFRNR